MQSSTLTKLMEQYFPISQLDSQRLYMIEDKILLHLFRGIYSDDLSNYIRLVFGNVKVQDFKWSLTNDGYILQNLKTYLFYAFSKNMQPSPKLRKHFQISKDDEHLVHRLHSNPELKERLQYLANNYKALNRKGLDKAIQKVYERTENQTRKTVNNKMRFILSAGIHEKEDMVMELQMIGIRAIMLTYPCIESHSHAVNIAGRSISNYGINMRKRYGEGKHGVLTQDSEGNFLSNKVSLDAIHSDRMSADDEGIYHFPGEQNWEGGESNPEVMGTGAKDNIQETQTTQISVSSIMENLKGKKLKFVQILMGLDNPDFDRWLRKEGWLKGPMDHEELHEYLLKQGRDQEFIRITCNYLGVDPDKGFRFVERLRRDLEAA